MFDRFLKRSHNLSRHLGGPFVAERERYMIHVCREGRAECVLAKINGLLLAIAQRIDVADSLPIKTEQISIAAEQWIHERSESYKTPQHMQSAKVQFVSVASVVELSWPVRHVTEDPAFFSGDGPLSFIYAG